MRYSQHVAIGIIVYFVALIPISIWILFRQDLSLDEFWINKWFLFRQFWKELSICFVLCIIGAMMPDVDIKSKSQKVVYTVLILTDIALILFRYYRAASILGLLAMLPMITAHRGPFHSVVAAIIVPIPALIIPFILAGDLNYKNLGVSYYIAFLLGYLSHIVADREGD